MARAEDSLNSIRTEGDLDKFLSDTDVLLAQCKSMLSRKNHDYAGNTDIFSNFKFAASAAGISPPQSILVLLGVKISRLSQLIGSGKEPLNEKIEDSIVDLINYALLLHGLLKKTKGEKDVVEFGF